MHNNNIFYTIGNGLQCYYCSHDATCNADEPGELVECQMNDPRERHYGDACEVAHTGKKYICTKFQIRHYLCIEFTLVSVFVAYGFPSFNSLPVNSTSEEFWWRGCKPRHDDPLLCMEHKTEYHDRNVVYDECVCDTNECNRVMGPIVTPSPGNKILDLLNKP